MAARQAGKVGDLIIGRAPDHLSVGQHRPWPIRRSRSGARVRRPSAVTGASGWCWCCLRGWRAVVCNSLGRCQVSLVVALKFPGHARAPRRALVALSLSPMSSARVGQGWHRANCDADWSRLATANAPLVSNQIQALEQTITKSQFTESLVCRCGDAAPCCYTHTHTQVSRQVGVLECARQFGAHSPNEHSDSPLNHMARVGSACWRPFASGAPQLTPPNQVRIYASTTAWLAKRQPAPRFQFVPPPWRPPNG